MTQTKDKKPDDETEHGGGRSHWIFGLNAAANGLFQVGATRVDADGMPVEHWMADVAPGGAAERALIEVVKQVGVELMGSGSVSLDKEGSKGVAKAMNRKSIELGDMIPCEVCGAATHGAACPGPWAPYEHDERVHDQVHSYLMQPDHAGRVFCETEGRVAVCFERDKCWDEFWNSYTKMHERAAEELGVKAWGRA